jgi:hypothetical protein
LLLGLGSSKARKRALAEVAMYCCDKCRGKVSEREGFLDGRSAGMSSPPASAKKQVASDADEKHKNGDLESHSVAAIMLGVPTGIVTAKTWKPNFAIASKTKAQPEKDKADDEVVQEMGPCIMALDVQGATAKPPYHIVLAVLGNGSIRTSWCRYALPRLCSAPFGFGVVASSVVARSWQFQG